MSFTVSKHIQKMSPSSTIAAMQKAQALKAQGKDVIDLSVGEPDFDTPQFIKNALWESVQRGETKYTATAGVKPLQSAITGFYERNFGVSYSPNQIMATSGGKQALFNAILTSVEEGDDVLIPAPYWVSFPEMVNAAGANNVFINTEETDFILTAEQVKRAITPKTKLLILNSPSNPSGRVIPSDEFRKIVEVCAERGIYVISDECYLLFVYPPNEVFSVASLPKEFSEFVCICGSFSKTYAMTGWRVGYTIAPETWTKPMLKLQSHSTSHPASFAQYACAVALDDVENSQKSVREMLAEYERRRNYFIPALNEIGLKCSMPEGAFYAFPDVRKFAATSGEFADKLLNETYCVTTDGAGFGSEGFIRISYATSMERLQESIERIKKIV
jgi:aspartate aminotransferase